MKVSVTVVLPVYIDINVDISRVADDEYLDEVRSEARGCAEELLRGCNFGIQDMSVNDLIIHECQDVPCLVE